MGIYIPGMEMPNTCYDCPFQIDECFGSIKCGYAKTWGSYSSRAVDCPLVPVPPHGRLIDADALVSVIAILQDKTDNAVVWEQMRYIADDMQTVIPAESEGE